MSEIRSDFQEHRLPVTRVTPDDGHYFFGYFDKYQFDPTGRYLLVNKASFMDRQPTVDDRLELGYIDLDDSQHYQPLTHTQSWCWQQGCMLQWLPGEKKLRYVYNDRKGEQFVSVIADIQQGEITTLPLPIYCISPNGRWAASTNFSRLAKERPGYGYEGVVDPWQDQHHPADDGIHIMDMQTGNHQLIVSLDQLVKHAPIYDSFATGPHWTNHLLFAPDSKRLMFLHRWRLENGGHQTRLFTVDIDGKRLCLLNDQVMTSHMAWIDPQHIIAFANQAHWGYYVFTDQSSKVEEVGPGQFDGDGHCTMSQDGRWMLTDTYPDLQTDQRTLILFDRHSNQRHDMGCFQSDSKMPSPTRCDLHPRWDRTGHQITFDSIHEGYRGVYLVDVQSVIKA